MDCFLPVGGGEAMSAASREGGGIEATICS